MSTLPGGTVTIPGLNPNDTLGSAILQTLNNLLTVTGSTTSISGASLSSGNQLNIAPVQGASSIVGDVTTSGVLNLANQPTNLEALVISAGDPATLGSGAVTVFGNGRTNFAIAAAQYTNLDFNTGGGSGTVNSGGGNNLFSTPSTPGSTSAWDFNATSGNNTVVAASGNNTISMGTGNNLIAVSNGTDQIASTGDDTVLLTGGAATINVAPGGSDVIAAYNNASFHFVSESASPSTVFGTNTSADYISGGTVAGGGGMFAGGSGGNNTLISGQGNTTLLGGGNGDQLSVTGSGNDLIKAGPGNETLNASTATGHVSVQTYMGTTPGSNLVATGSSGADTFVAGGNTNATFTGNGGQDVYEVIKGQAPQTITITDWTSSDTLQTFGYGTPTFHSIAGGFQATLSDGSVITLKTTLASLTNIQSH
jgi:serralysin